MTRKLNIMIIHGVGWGDSHDHFADELKANIAKQFDGAIKALGLTDIARPSSDEALRFAPVYWSPVTQDPQDELIKLLGVTHTSRIPLSNVLFEIQRQMISLVGDIIAYGDPTVYGAIHAAVAAAVTSLSEASADERGDDDTAHLTVIGHSLGSVIASDYVYDHRDREQDRRYLLPDYHFKVKNVVLLGSPMAMYSLRGNPGATREAIKDSLKRPIQVDPDNGLWLNMYDPQDPIGLPLRPIESYHDEGVIDYKVKAGNWLTGWNAASHTGYWRSKEVARVIARKLALDWAALNSRAFADTHYTPRVAALRESLGADD
jgi:pimeloyl-ACP methyl ester carboxylesterase